MKHKRGHMWTGTIYILDSFLQKQVCHCMAASFKCILLYNEIPLTTVYCTRLLKMFGQDVHYAACRVNSLVTWQRWCQFTHGTENRDGRRRTLKAVRHIPPDLISVSSWRASHGQVGVLQRRFRLRVSGLSGGYGNYMLGLEMLNAGEQTRGYKGLICKVPCIVSNWACVHISDELFSGWKTTPLWSARLRKWQMSWIVVHLLYQQPCIFLNCTADA